MIEKAVGYCDPNPFGDYRIPIPLQNIIYRDYANKRGFSLALSINEIVDVADKPMLLNFLKFSEQKIDHIIFLTREMFPISFGESLKLGSKIFSRGLTIHFVYEDVILGSEDELEELLTLKLLSTEIRSHNSV